MYQIRWWVCLSEKYYSSLYKKIQLLEAISRPRVTMKNGIKTWINFSSIDRLPKVKLELSCVISKMGACVFNMQMDIPAHSLICTSMSLIIYGWVGPPYHGEVEDGHVVYLLHSLCLLNENRLKFIWIWTNIFFPRLAAFLLTLPIFFLMLSTFFIRAFHICYF